MADHDDPTHLKSSPGRDGVSRDECHRCTSPIAPGANFCPACGLDLTARVTGTSFSGLDKDVLIDGRYRILEKLGEGGMGTVYKVEHVRMGKVAAVKLMRADAVVDKALAARFLQEARVVARLSHPNTVQVFDSGELPGGHLYMAMEYVPGKDLAWQLRTHGPMKEETATAIAIQLLKSLQEAHEAGIVHRDIKPANIMLTRRRKSAEDVVKLLDFGIAKLAESESRKSTTGDFIGTPAYMSPEQIRGEPLDARSDLYSLGAFLFEAVTGRQVYVGTTPIMVITQHLGGNVPAMSEVAPHVQVSPGFEAVVRRALALKPENRFADADAFRAALEALNLNTRMPTRDLTPLSPVMIDNMLSRSDFDSFERNLRVKRVLLPVIALASLGLIGFAAVQSIRNPEPAQVSGVEIEPNDDPLKATPFALGAPVTGTMGARAADDVTGDRDLFVATVPGGPVRLTLSGVADLNLTVEVLQMEPSANGSRLTRKLFLDDTSVGGEERVDALALNQGQVFVRVEEQPFCTEPNRPPRERSRVPYTLRLDTIEGTALELEPNDTELTAQALPLTRALTAFAGSHVDEFEKVTSLRSNWPPSAGDFFKVEAPASETVVIAVVPPTRGTLQVTDMGAKVKSGKRPQQLVSAGVPALIRLEPGADGLRRMRVVPVAETLPGATYRLAAATSGPNGIAGLLDLHRVLQGENPAAANTLLQAARVGLPASPELAQLKEAPH